MYYHLKITGVILVLLSLIHLAFPKYFEWKKDLSAVTLLTRQMMYVHTFFLAMLVFFMGLLCIYATDDLLFTRLGNQLSMGLFLFWLVRLLFQFFVYSPMLWRGKRFESIVHIFLILLWTYLSIVFLLVFINEKSR